MKRSIVILRVGLLGIMLACSLFVYSLPVMAITPPALTAPNGLSLLELKVTGDEFVVLQNNTGADITDLSTYALYYFNNFNPFARDVSSSIQNLPAIGLTTGGSLVLSADARPTCGAEVAGKLSLSLGDTAGFLEVVQLGQGASGAVTQTAGDVVSWSSGANGIIQNLPSNTKDGAALFYRYLAATNPDTFAWQYADVNAANSCELDAVIVSGTTKTTTPTNGLLSDTTSPPATIVSLASEAAGPDAAGSGATMPASDMGLKAPQLSEIMPNPAGTGTDSTDEFVELYNPNGSNFDLSGFILQTGSTTSATRHNYTFPAGTTLSSKSFKAYSAEETGLSMSNSGGQVWLLDPFTTSIGQSEVYGSAKDGQSWALAKGTWYWTTSPTPGKANVINQPATTTKSKSSTSKTAKTSTGTPVTKVGAAGSSTSSSGYNDSLASVSNVTPVHPWTLAVVAGVALLYGAYEYRTDIGNRLYQWKQHRATRRAARP